MSNRLAGVLIGACLIGASAYFLFQGNDSAPTPDPEQHLLVPSTSSSIEAGQVAESKTPIEPVIAPILLAEYDGRCCAEIAILANKQTIRSENEPELKYFDLTGAEVTDLDGVFLDDVIAGTLLTHNPSPPKLRGFESFNDPHLELPDGRVLVRGSLNADKEVESTGRRINLPEGATVEPWSSSDPPVRLFVYDPADESFVAISHFPELRDFSTAVSESRGPDAIFDIHVVPGTPFVVYTSGRGGAAYSIPFESYLAEIPTRR